jgi:hypothetical protein
MNKHFQQEGCLLAMKVLACEMMLVIVSRPQNFGARKYGKFRKRREWTKDGVRQLKTLARQKTPVGQIAKSLKRTAGATEQKAFTLGISLDTRG